MLWVFLHYMQIFTPTHICGYSTNSIIFFILTNKYIYIELFQQTCTFTLNYSNKVLLHYIKLFQQTSTFMSATLITVDVKTDNFSNTQLIINNKFKMYKQLIFKVPRFFQLKIELMIMLFSVRLTWHFWCSNLSMTQLENIWFLFRIQILLPPNVYTPSIIHRCC